MAEKVKGKEDDKNLIILFNSIARAKYFKMMSTPKKFIFYNFIGGVFKGLGFAVGTSIIFALLIWILSKLSIIPIIGNLVLSILKYVQNLK